MHLNLNANQTEHVLSYVRTRSRKLNFHCSAAYFFDDLDENKLLVWI